MKKITISKSSTAIDACWWDKGMSIEGAPEPKERIAVIGDSESDFPFLKLEGLLFRGAPFNARESVKNFLVTINNGYISKKDLLKGFFDCVDKIISMSADRGLNARDVTVYTDRDGVIYTKGDYSQGRRFATRIRNMGIDSPLVRIITGSSLVQNQESGFMDAFGLNAENLARNQRVQDDPYLVLIENGAIKLNVLNPHDMNNVALTLEPELTQTLVGEFRNRLMERIEREIFPSMHLHWQKNYMLQKEDPRGVYPSLDKKTMTTMNTPHALRDQKIIGEVYKSNIVKFMEEIAEGLNLPYEVLQ
jgi:hypothetical protein